MNFLDDSSSSIDENTLEVNVTSFIDVLFVLLLFFMVTTNFDDSRGMHIKLPSARAGTSTTETTKINVQVSAQGEISIDGAHQEISTLKNTFEQLKLEKPEAVVVLRADTSTTHGSVVQAMDAASSAGFAKIAIATSPTTRNE